MAQDTPRPEICSRISTLRLEVDGHRGKASFAKKLGLSPSTYDYYENDRIPPADVLVRIADLAGVDLRWLVTGHTPAQPVPASHPVIQRAAALLAQHPQAAQPLAAFVDLLAASMAFPVKTTEPAQEPASDAGAAAQADAPRGPERRRQQAVPTRGRESWIPVLGRSAAGVPAFWSAGEGDGVTLLADVVARHAGEIQQHAVRAESPDPLPAGLTAPLADDVQLITLRQPEGEVAEFVASPTLKARYADAFALRIDGNSMHPDIAHGDLVLLSPSAPAVDGKAAVVQLRDQIGVTCKLLRRDGGRVHLVPINDQLPPQTFPAESVVWALRVLAKVRPVG